MKRQQPDSVRRPFQASPRTAAVAASAVTAAIMASAQMTQEAQAQPPQAPKAKPGAVQFSDQDAVSKFYIRGYNYCDAMVLADFWKESTPYDAKVRLGHKILAWGPSDGEFHVRQARGEALKKPVEELPCWYTDGGYSYDDAELLGQYWGTGISDSKIRMTRLLIGGNDVVIKAALRSAHAGQ